MRPIVDETHDRGMESWIESANSADTDFPIQNLPFGSFRCGSAAATIGVAIGDLIVDVRGVANQRSLALGDTATLEACRADSLNALMALGTGPRRALRKRLHALLRKEASADDQQTLSRHLVRQADVEMLVPANIGDYTDFYASIFHATNVGSLFRPDNPLLPNYKYVPIGYHGRASSLVASDTPVRRPCGQTRHENTEPVFGPSKALDYELELGFFVSKGNSLGETVAIREAEDHLFGVCLLNDWSARDVQAWEYQPLGPFLAKSFATSLSPWVVTMEALAPFRVPAFARAAGDPAPLPYLFDSGDQETGGLDVQLEVFLSSEQMREEKIAPMRMSCGSFRDMYWTIAQMLTHHASNGCNLCPGDLLGSGTVSGPSKDARGCLLELTARGEEPIALPTGEQRKFLEDGDEVTLRGFCARDGFRQIGLGTCRGVVLAAALPER
jgi:fumarylacetoacetase